MAIDERGVNLRITADASEVRKGTEEAKQAVREMADDVTRQGARAGSGIDAIGRGSEDAAKKVDRNTRNMIASIQRQTAVLEAGSRSNAKYWETLADQRNIDKDVLRPYLDQLEAVQAKQSVANAALGAGAVQFDKYGMSARQTAAAMRGVPAQLTDIVVSLQGGQRPMTVLLQQGGQLKDMFGGIVPAAKALSTTFLGMINPITLVAGAIGAIGVAYFKGAQESVEFNKALTLTGGIAGVSASQLGLMADRIGSVAGSTGQAASALTQIANTSKLAGAGIEDIGRTAVAMNAATGKAVSDTIAEFVKLGEEPAKASKALNEQYNYLTTAVYEQIKALEEQGRKEDAAALAQKTYSDAMETRASEVKRNLGAMEWAWDKLATAASNAWNAMLDIGRDNGLATELANAEKALEQMRNGYFKTSPARIAAAEAEVQRIRDAIEAEGQLAKQKAETARIQQEGNAAVNAVSAIIERNLSKQEQMTRALADYHKQLERIRAANPNSELLQADAIAAAEKAIRDQYKETTGGARELTEAEKELKRQREAALKAVQAFEREREKALRGQYNEISSIEEKTRKIEDEIAVYGLGAEAVMALDIARLEEQKTVLQGFAGSEEQIALIEREIEARKRLMSATSRKEALNAETRAREEYLREWQRTNEQIGQSLTDALLRGFESGKSFGENFRDTLKNMFRTLILQPVIQPIMNQVAGSIQSFTGLGAGNVGNMAGASSGFGGMPTLGAGTIQNIGGWLSTSGVAPNMGANMVMNADKIAGIGGNVLGYGKAIFDLTQGKYGSAAGTAIGTAVAGPIGAVVGSVLGGFADSLFGGGPPKTRHGQRTTFELGRGITSYDDRQAQGADVAAAAFAQTSVAAANELFRKIGVDAAIDSFYAIMESSVLGDRDGVASGGALRVGDQKVDFGVRQSSDMTLAGFGGWSDAEMLPRLQTDIQLSVLEAFQKVGDQLPSVLSDMLQGVHVRGLDEAGAADLAQRFSAVVEGASAFLQGIEALPFEQLRGLSFDAAAAMAQFSGGIENFVQASSTYLQNFYSDAERQQIAIGNISEALAGVGVEMPAVVGSAEEIKAAYRSLVEAQDLNTEAGRKAYAALMGLSGAFAEVANYAGQAAAQAEQLAQREAELSLQRQKSMLETMLGMVDSSYAAVQQHSREQIAKLQESFGSTDSAMNAYRSAVQRLESELGSLFSSIDRYVSDLRGTGAAFEAQYNQARAVISTALVTGQLPQTADLSEALRVAQQGVTGQMYGSRFEQERAYLQLASEMEALKGIAQPELDTAKATLQELERHYNRLRGIEDIAEGSLRVLEQQIRAALGQEESARRQIAIIEQQLAAAQGTYEEMMGLNDALKDLPAALKAFADAIANLKLAAPASYLNANQDVADAYAKGAFGDMTPEQAAAYHYARHGALEGRDSAGMTLSPELSYLVNNPDVAAAYNAGVMPAVSLEEFARIHYERHGKYEGRSFAVGTNYVPYDMTAQIHEGERIIPKADNEELMRRLSQPANDPEQKQLLRQIVNRLERLEAAGRTTAVNTGRIGQTLDDAMQGGNAFRTKEVATA